MDWGPILSHHNPDQDKVITEDEWMNKNLTLLGEKELYWYKHLSLGLYFQTYLFWKYNCRTL